MDKVITILLLAFACTTNGESFCTVVEEPGELCLITVDCKYKIASGISIDISNQECVKTNYAIIFKAKAISNTKDLLDLNDDMLTKITKIIITDSTIYELKTTSLTNVEEIILAHNKFSTFNIGEVPFNTVTKIDYSHNLITVLEGKASSFFTKLHTFDLSYNLIEVISMNYFQYFDELKHLDLSNNKLKAFVVLGMYKLNTLNLAHNNLQNIDEVNLKFENLIDLNLAYNIISSANNNSFRMLTKLETFDLSCNQIATLEAITFKNLKQLKTLNIAENGITNIPNTLLYNNTNLQKLFLHKNHIDVIKNSSFINNQIKKISVNDNSLIKLDKDAFLGLKDDKLDLSNNKIFQIELQFKDINLKLTEINLKNNSIGIIGPTTFKDLKALKILDLSHNHLTELDFDSSDLAKLTHLNASNNNIAIINDIFLNNLTALLFLDLSSNQIDKFYFSKYNLGTVTNLILSNNSLFSTQIVESELKSYKNVIEMDISNTKLTEFKENAFKEMTNLKKFNSSGCALNKIDLTAFSGAKSLEVLDLSNNLLPEFSIKDLLQLKELYLNINHISSIDNMLINVPNLEKISLAQNDIKKIQPIHFKNTANLKKIDLSQNNLLEIDDKTFDSKVLKEVRLDQIKFISFKNDVNTVIEELYLSNCGIQDIASFYIKNVKQLKILDVSNNKIQFILKTLFEKYSLASLNLSNNEIQYIQPNTFEGYTQLESLDLHHNQLRSFKGETLLGVKTLKILDLSDNELLEFDLDYVPKDNTPQNIYLDINNLTSINFDNMLYTNVKEISIGSNKISCSNIKKITNNTSMTFKVTTKEFDKKYSDFNGITCDKQELNEEIKFYLAKLESLLRNLKTKF